MSDDFFNPTEYPRARKDHTCEMCRLEIPAGQKYALETGHFDGIFFRRKLHIHCHNILDEYMKESWDSEFDYDWIFDWLQEGHCHDCGLFRICHDDWYKFAFQCPTMLRPYLEVV